MADELHEHIPLREGGPSEMDILLNQSIPSWERMTKPRTLNAGE
jgi:hypothetical protein